MLAQLARVTNRVGVGLGLDLVLAGALIPFCLHLDLTRHLTCYIKILDRLCIRIVHPLFWGLKFSAISTHEGFVPS